MSKAKSVLLALTPVAILGGCSDNADKRSEDVLKATPAQEAARVEAHKTNKMEKRTYHVQ